MINTIEELSEVQKKFIKYAKKSGNYDGIINLLTNLYPGNAHFIYELLQNAEDTGATTVRFSLFENSLRFDHNGERLFSLEDVKSITKIGKSTKVDDPTSIGKFGVGFKAVFAYTASPEIHSDKYHFRIRDLVIPEIGGVPRPILGTRSTQFLLPFNHPDKPSSTACEEVRSGLTALDANTLLFLKNIRTIKYRLPNGEEGHIKRTEHADGYIKIATKLSNGETRSSYWLRFDKHVPVQRNENSPHPYRVSIAFRLSRKVDHRQKVLPQRGRVSIFFPAEKETSNLRFHLHAPFASTVARDSVRQCPENDILRDGLSELVVESLSRIRHNNLLNMDFLSILPIEQDNIPPFYEPIREAIIEAFKKHPLTPTKEGGHAPAIGLYRGPASISNVLTDEDLAKITGHSPPLWAANPPQKNQREDRFLDSLDIDLWEWYNFSRTIKNLRPFKDWLATKDDAWVLSFYALLGEAYESHYAPIGLEKLRIIRVISGQDVIHELPRKSFIPPNGNSSLPPNIQLVKPEVYQTKRSKQQKRLAEFFLEKIGVRPFDERTVIELKLASYTCYPEEVEAPYFQDIESFCNYWKKNPKDTSLFQNYNFLISESPEGALAWCKPRDACLDEPFVETSLSDICHIHKRAPVWCGYADQLDTDMVDIFISFTKAIGVLESLTVTPAKVSRNPSKIYHQIGNTTRTGYEYSEDYSIEGIEELLELKTIQTSRLIWDALIQAESKAAKAKYRPNRSRPMRESDSQIVHHLKRSAWIPNKDGQFCLPQDISRNDLREDFVFNDDNGLLSAIEFSKHVIEKTTEYEHKNKQAQSMGFESIDEASKMAEVAMFFRTSGQSPESFLASQKVNDDQPTQDFPTRTSNNSQRRKAQVSEQYEDAPDREYKQQKRSVRDNQGDYGQHAYLRNEYDKDGELFCQVCKKVMPFKKRDGDYYFESVEVFHNYFPKGHRAQYLALCPLCAAMYKEFVKKVPSATDELRYTIKTSHGTEFPLLLGEEDTSVKFTQVHLDDIRTIIGEIEYDSTKEVYEDTTQEESNEAVESNNDNLKNALLKLRAEKIESICSERMDESILSDAWIERFIARKPSSLEEWQNIFPENIRTTMKCGKGWLKMVFEVIEEYR